MRSLDLIAVLSQRQQLMVETQQDCVVGRAGDMIVFSDG